jgi:hypothetical protein
MTNDKEGAVKNWFNLPTASFLLAMGLIVYGYIWILIAIHSILWLRNGSKYLLIMLTSYWVIADAIRIIATFRLFGVPSLEAFKKMLAFDVARARTIDAGRRVHVLVHVVIGSVLAFISLIAWLLSGDIVFLFVVIFIFVFLFGRAVTHTGMPPSILLLANSRNEATKLHQAFADATFGIFRIVSMLEHGSLGKGMLAGMKTNWIYFGNLRTAANDWESTIRVLIEISPIILVDMREIGEAVEREIDFVFQSGQTGKLFLLVYNKKKMRGRGPVWSRLRAAVDVSRIYEPADFVNWFKTAARSPKLLPKECRFG